jgi:formyltetrahydrofolate synthetase
MLLTEVLEGPQMGINFGVKGGAFDGGGEANCVMISSNVCVLVVPVGP